MQPVADRSVRIGPTAPAATGPLASAAPGPFGPDGTAGVPHRTRLAENDVMKISRTIIVLDAADLNAVSSFWAGLLGGTVHAEDDWHSVSVDGEWRIGVQLAPDHVPPEWPDGTPQQIHLDLWIDDLRSAHEEAVSLGARLLKPADDLSAREGFQVYADPAGHPFCLCWG